MSWGGSRCFIPFFGCARSHASLTKRLLAGRCRGASPRCNRDAGARPEPESMRKTGQPVDGAVWQRHHDEQCRAGNGVGRSARQRDRAKRRSHRHRVRAVDPRCQLDQEAVAVNIIEAISAEDIGKLPDVSIADSLSRLTGVAVQEVGGPRQVHLDPWLRPRLYDGDAQWPDDRDRRRQPAFRLWPVSGRPVPGNPGYQDAVGRPAQLRPSRYAVNLQTYDPLTQKNSFAINVQGGIGQYKSAQS